MTKAKRKRDDVLIKRNETLINRDNVNAKHEKIIDLLDKTMTNKTNKKKNDDVEFKQKKKKSINFEIMTTTSEEKMMIKKKFQLKTMIFKCLKFSM